MSCINNHLTPEGICTQFGVSCIGGDCVHYREELTNAQALRSMSDGALARALLKISDGVDTYCKHMEECVAAVERDEDIPDSRCIASRRGLRRYPVFEAAYRNFQKDLKELRVFAAAAARWLLWLLVNLTLPLWIVPYYVLRRRRNMNMKNWKLALVALLVLLVLVICAGCGNQHPGKPIARVTYYQMPDGSIQTVIENIGDAPLIITQDGFLFPEGEGDYA